MSASEIAPMRLVTVPALSRTTVVGVAFTPRRSASAAARRSRETSRIRAPRNAFRNLGTYSWQAGQPVMTNTRTAGATPVI